MSEPRCIEVDVTASASGKVQIVQYKLFNEFFFSHTEKYEIPEDWTPEQIAEWKDGKTKALKETLDHYAQVEQDALLAQSDWYTGE